MAAAEKIYPYTLELLLNAVYDIKEMCKAQATKLPGRCPDTAEVELMTDMYAVKQSYLFRLTRGAEGTLVVIESDDGAGRTGQSVHLMLSSQM